jgi:hypothetical protein
MYKKFMFKFKREVLDMLKNLWVNRRIVIGGLILAAAQVFFYLYYIKDSAWLVK